MANQNILVTGASGKTGNAVISALSKAGFQVTAFTHKEKYAEELKILGARIIEVGDLRSEVDLARALEGKMGIYHICPNMTPDEFEIGNNIIRICKEKEVKRFVYHSVLHPQVKSMPHHWQKLLVEEELFKSGLEYTVLQPAAYMQNLFGYRESILNGKYAMPYRMDARISMVDLRDVGEVVAKAFTDQSMVFGVYELVGMPPYSQSELVQILSAVIGIQISGSEISRDEWRRNALQNNMPDYPRETLLAMFEYYDKFGFRGSMTSLTCLLGRKPITIEQFLVDEFIPNNNIQEY